MQSPDMGMGAAAESLLISIAVVCNAFAAYKSTGLLMQA
jgi:hypothetical protein